MLGEVEVFSFNASALGVNDNNINFVGTTAATGINNITQFPVNWQAEYQNNVSQQEIVITSDVAGPQPTWSIVVDNNGVTGNEAGDIGFDGPTFDTVQANLIDIITFPDGTSQTTAAVSGGADELSITDTDKLNLLEDGTILSTVTLPDSGVSDYDDLTNKPIERLKTIETIVLGGTRSNTVDYVVGTNEFSTITLLNTFDSSGVSSDLNTTADITYSTSFSAAGQWHFGLSVGFSNGTTIADGTAWTTLNNFYLSDLTLSGGTGIANQVDVGDVIRITIGSGSATFDVTESENSSIISHIRLNNARGIVGTINGIHTSSETISFTATVQTTAGASFSFTPDTDGTVYTSSVTNAGFTNEGSNITSNITDIANAITALETNITWDGIITQSETSNNIVSNSIGFRDTVSVGFSQWAIIENVDPFPGLVPTIGDAWSTMNGYFITEATTSINRLYDNVEVGDAVRFTWGDGSASFPVTEKTSRSTLLGNAYNVVGTIGRTFTDGESFTLAADIIRASSSITLDLGTDININSSFTLSGGTNNMNSLVNTDGTPATGNPIATTVTVTDGYGTEVTSFTASVPRNGDNDIDIVGQRIADAVSNNVETPIDFSATYDSTTNALVLTAALAGETQPWTITFDNNGLTGLEEGNLRVETQIQDGEVINQIDIISFPDGTSQTTAATGGGVDGDLFVNITKGGTFLDATGTKLPSGRDATDTRGNSTAKWNTIDYNDTMYYWIQEVGLPKASIIRIDNITDGSIVTSKTY